MMSRIFFLLTVILISSCGTTIHQSDVEGCWVVSYIETDGLRDKAGDYYLCFESDGTMTSEREDGKQKVKAEWNIEEKDSTIVMYYQGNSMPDTFKILKVEPDEMYLRIKKKLSYITLYLRKKK